MAATGSAFRVGEVDTVGELQYEITHTSTIEPFYGSVQVRRAMRTIDIANGAITNADIAD